MPSVLGLLDAREKKAREEVVRLPEEAERVRAALPATERDLDRLADARVTVTEVLAEEPSAGHAGPVRPVRPVRATVSGSVVPPRAEGIGLEVLAPQYQQILSVLAAPEAADWLWVKQFAVQLGWKTTPARIEGCARG